MQSYPPKCSVKCTLLKHLPTPRSTYLPDYETVSFPKFQIKSGKVSLMKYLAPLHPCSMTS